MRLPFGAIALLSLAVAVTVRAQADSVPFGARLYSGPYKENPMLLRLLVPIGVGIML
jgi:hypothetical protein